MTGSAPRLDLQTLERYDEQLRHAGVPVDAWAKPGLTASEISTTVESIGLSLPSEVRLWWEWHDGPRPNTPGIEQLYGPSKQCLDLAGSVAKYEQSREVAELSASAWPHNDPDQLWAPSWFPITRSARPVAVQCAVGEADRAPVLLVDWEDRDRYAKPRAQSFGEMIGWWIRAIEIGGWRWNAAKSEWDVHDEKIEEDFPMNPLMWAE